MANFLVCVSDDLTGSLIESFIRGSGCQVQSLDDPALVNDIVAEWPRCVIVLDSERMNSYLIVKADAVAPKVGLDRSWPALADRLKAVYGGRRLTRRELEVAGKVAEGLGNRRISQLLCLQEQSVKNLVYTTMRKLNCKNRTQLANMLNSL